MTQEEKAKAYDEALKVLHKYDGANIMFSQSLKEEMFPELAESEDEKIRKSIIAIINNYVDNSNTFKPKMIAWLEKQGEQKPTNKVESKFHEGDWVVQGCNILKIRCVGDEYYCYETVGGYVDDMLISEIDSLYHLWTIQDAKDGDMLIASDGSIFIFKDTIDGACKHYVALTTDNVVKFNEGLEHYWETQSAVHPATKEQRDLLFQKMKEAGYEWDAELKQLRKIEQKPDWSEEDENRINRLIAYFEDKESFTAEDDIVYANWLKSLKDRVQPKPRQEWSEEEHQIIKDAASVILDCVNTVETKKEEERLEELADKLQNLRPQNTWKPSDEQIIALRWVLNNIPYNKHKEEISGLLDQIKEL